MNPIRSHPVGTEAEVEDLDPSSIDDEKFDQIYPPTIRELSSLFWTPVAVAAEAAKLLVTAPGTRVLDVGCGPGKFCLVAAAATEGRFAGVEQRGELIAAARQAAHHLSLSRVEFVHANLMEIAFGDYDAFYLFNPFEENMHGHTIDSAIPLSAALFKKYTKHVAAQLDTRPIGTRVVTYMGYADDIPASYDCESALFGDDLKLWIKKRESDRDIERLGLRISRSYRGANGWVAPRPSGE
ncbi:MAG: class I SAM-dependent methyltransferase [Verrucomicrobiota bacterium]|nr:class I SAM-dependent methyltransferase [Verrucomicrobiota bacterium]